MEVIIFLYKMSSEILLVGEIRRNCDFAILAYGDMAKYASALNNDELNRFWLSAESFLIAVANISKILWPTPHTQCKKCNFQSQPNLEMISRRESLRKLLSVEDSSPIRSRRFRNHFEHYDERIEEWATKPGKECIFDSNIGSIESIIRNPNHSISYRRNFDSSNFVLHFDDEEYCINEVIKAVLYGQSASLGCIRNGFVAAAAATMFNVPFDTIKNALKGFAGLTGCGGIVDMDQIQNSTELHLLLVFEIAASFIALNESLVIVLTIAK